MKSKFLLGLLVITMLITMTCVVSAIDISYSDSYLPSDTLTTTGQTSGDVESIQNIIEEKNTLPQNDLTISKYPKVEITEDPFLFLFGGDPIIDIEIIDHTEYCTIDCYSILEATLYKTTTLMDELETRSFVNNNLEYTNNIETKVYYLKNISYIEEQDQYEDVCQEINLGDVHKNVCQPIKTITTNTLKYKEEFVEYNNEELSPGKYIIKITGKKNSFNQIIDWVPTIQNEKIEALAWWNITQPYGNGSMGDVYFSVSTKVYGNMTLNVDYTIGGNTLFLMTDRAYNFNTFYLGPGTTLSTNNATGSAMYLMSKNIMEIYGLVNFTGRLQPGQYNSTSFSYLGDSFTTPSVANGGSGYAGGSQAGGFGGGGDGGAGNQAGCPATTAGQGATGGFPFGSGGGGASVQSTNDGCQNGNGGDGVRSGAGGGAASAYDSGSNCDIRATGGAGGGSYGASGGTGTSTGTHGTTWSCTSGSIGLGGGGAGGSAGRPGLNLVLRSENLSITGTIYISGTNGQNGGNGGAYIAKNWQSNVWTTIASGDSGTGGGGGGGASAGSVKIYYRYLTNSSSLNNSILQTAGSGGSGGTWNSGANPASSGGSGSAGTLTTYAEGFVSVSSMNPTNSSSVVIPSIMNFSATLTPTIATLVNATFYLWNGTGVLNNTQSTVLSGTSPVGVSWTRTAAQIPDGSYSWGMRYCYTDGTVAKCEYTQNNTFTTFSVQFTNTTYTTPVYEMTNQTYSINVTSTGFVNLSADLIWNGVVYPAVTSGNSVNATFTRSIWIPIGTGNKTFYWDVSYGGQSKLSSSNNVTVLDSQYVLCNSTINQTYLSINYRDEVTNNPVNATIVNSIWNYNITNSPYGETYYYVTPTVNGTQATSLNHNFCFTPRDASIIIPSATYQYGDSPSGYVTKTWTFSSLPLTNSTTAITLWMINIADSGTTPVTLQVINSNSNTVLSGARVSIFRTINGNPTMVNDGFTDTAGTIAYYMSPITAYTIQVNAAGCSQFTSTITPVNSLYNIFVNCQGLVNTTFYADIDGIYYQRAPAGGVSAPGMNTYIYAINSTIYNMTRVKFDLFDTYDNSIVATNDTLTDGSTPGCSTDYCYLTLQYQTYGGDNIKGRYYVSVSNDTSLITLEGDAYWRYININMNNSVNSFGRFFSNVQTLFNSWGNAGGSTNCVINTDKPSCNAVSECKWVNQTTYNPLPPYNQQTLGICVLKDEFNKIEFNRIVTIFFFFVVFLFILGRTTGYEMNHPGSFVIGMSLVIWILSIYNMFTFAGLTAYDYFNQYIFALTTTFIGAGYAMSVIRRYSQ